MSSTPLSEKKPAISARIMARVVRALPDVLADVGAHFRQVFRESQLLQVASSLAYTTILSLIPLLAVSFAIFKAFGGLKKVYEVVTPFIVKHLAEGSGEEVATRLQQFIENVHGAAIGVGGLIALIFTSMSMLYSIEKAINGIWRAPINRGWVQRIGTYWMFITLGPLGFAVAIGFATSASLPLTHLLPRGTGIFLILGAFLAAVYQLVPNTRVRLQYSLATGYLASGAICLAAEAYGLYTKRVVSYHQIYGSLGAVPLLLLWIYILWVIVLSGAAGTAALQKRLDARIQREAQAEPRAPV